MKPDDKRSGHDGYTAIHELGSAKKPAIPCGSKAERHFCFLSQMGLGKSID